MNAKTLALALSLSSLLTAGPALAGPMDGVWVGEYVCARGKMALALTIREAPAGGADVLFQFSGTPQNPMPMGSFQMKAGMDAFSGGLVFSPSKWVQQPAGFTMVGLKGKLHDANTLMGEVTGAPSCTTFIVRRGGGQFEGTFKPVGFEINFKTTGAQTGFDSTGASIKVEAGGVGVPGSGEMAGAGMRVQAPGMNVQMNAGMQGSVTVAGGPGAAPVANINVTIQETPMMDTPRPVSAAPAPPRETCRSMLLAKGHSSTALIHCGDDVNQACAVALLKAGHSPTGLIHCQDLGDPSCAVQLLQSGRNPTEIIHCD